MREARFSFCAALRASTALIAAPRLPYSSPILIPAALLALEAAFAPALAQTWTGPGTDFNTGGNWSTGSVPDSTASTVFQGNGAPTNLSTSAAAEVGTVTFNTNAPNFLITLGNDFTINGDVVNNSVRDQSFRTSAGFTLTLRGDSGSVGSVGYDLLNGGTIQFSGGSSGGSSFFDLGSSGVLMLGSDSASRVVLGGIGGGGGTIVNNNAAAATVAVGAANTNTTFGGIFRDGTSALLLEKVGTGMLTLAGDSTHTGTTTISGGTLRLGAGGTSGSLGTGAVLNNASLVFNRSDTATVSNAISGTGSVTQAGSGTTILTGNNTYSGVTTISGGTLQVGNGGTTGSLGSGGVTSNGTLVFDRASSFTFANAITGTGAVTQADTGTTILTGANTYTGTTTISAGTLQIGNGGTTGALGSGNVVNNAALAYNRSDAVTVTNVISGTGTVTQAGTGNLILTGANTYAGATFVNSGRLPVNGSIASSSEVTVASGATLGGSGSLPGTSVLSGGTIAPGNSIGTLNVSGNLTLVPGSSTEIEVQGPLADRINVSGTAALGGTLRLLAQGGTYTFNTPYALIQAGAVTGNFGAVNATGSFGAGVTSTVSTTSNQAQLTLTPTPLVPIVTPPTDPVVEPPAAPPPVIEPPAAPPPAVSSAPVIGPRGSANQVFLAAGLDRAVAGGAAVSALFPLYNLPAAALPRGLDQVSGQLLAVASGMHAQPAYQFLDAILDRAAAAGRSVTGPAGRRRATRSGRAASAAVGGSAPRAIPAPMPRHPAAAAWRWARMSGSTRRWWRAWRSRARALRRICQMAWGEPRPTSFRARSTAPAPSGRCGSRRRRPMAAWRCRRAVPCPSSARATFVVVTRALACRHGLRRAGGLRASCRGWR
jgi:autotransporter-associated beta strand protein